MSSDTTSSDEYHLKVLRLLESDPSLSQRELAEALGVSLGKTNYCIRALLDKGLIKMQNFRNSQNKLSYAYLLTPAGIAAKAELAADFLKIKLREYEALRREIEALRREAPDEGMAK
uniref:MarR family EPS-associated transcriptional regulator n=1 Tax=Castellaniella defragrans TaxID=75697 RepID=UPI00333F155A